MRKAGAKPNMVRHMKGCVAYFLRIISNSYYWTMRYLDFERYSRVRAFASHADPLVGVSNWIALIIGTHLPFWPLYIWWSTGSQAMPSALLTMLLAPLFLVIPLISLRNGLAGRISVILAGNANTVFTKWVLGTNSGSALFLLPCAVLAAISFRASERRLQIATIMLPFLIWVFLQRYAPAGLHHYDELADRKIVILNGISVSILIGLFGWLKIAIKARPSRLRKFVMVLR
jgi:hypothetical protein